MKFFLFSIIFLSTSLFCAAQNSKGRATVTGYIKDNSNGEALIGATIYIRELKTGTITNEYGFYSLTLNADTYTVQASYVGFDTHLEKLPLTTNIRLDFSLTPGNQELEEVVVEGEVEEIVNVENIEMSTNRMRVSTITKMPFFLEADVLKSLVMLPGVSTVGEGATGFNVRGGSSGQNVTLLDEAPMYNPSHLFGFFSVFNPDAVKDVKLYKGAISARYGGRLASVLDIRMKEGNNKHLVIQGGIGLLFSRLAVEAPIIKGKSSFIVSVRRSYFDVFTSIVAPDIGNMHFYDVMLKANYSINKKNKIYISGYLGRDAFKIGDSQGFSWGNLTSTIRWNHLYNDRLFSNTTFVYSNYDYQLLFNSSGSEQENRENVDWRSSIFNFIIKPQFTYFIDDKNELDFGANLTYYHFSPANAQITFSQDENSTLNNGTNSYSLNLEQKYNMETAVYVSNRQKISRVLSLKYGLRFTYFQAFGPGTEYKYKEGTLGLRKPLATSNKYEFGEIMSAYSNFEPRFSFKIQTGKNSSIKGSYNRMAQYLHLISNALSTSPLNVWVPSSNNIKPEIGDQFTLGHFRNLGKGKKIEISIEGYYRQTQNQVGYIDRADLLLNTLLEGDLLSGQGRAYGMELYFQRKTGRLNGWVSYTLGRTELKIDGTNKGEWYPTRYDQTHNLKIALLYDINDRISISSSFTYVSGVPATLPTSLYRVQDTFLFHNAQESRNNVRIPHYSRLDIALRFQGRKTKRNGERKKIVSYWDFSLYNVYARENPFAIRLFIDYKGNTSIKQLSILGSIMPSLTWNFKFINNKSY